MSTFYFKRHDTSQIQAQLKDETGAPINLTGATVVFTMRAQGSPTPAINDAAVTIITPLTGTVGFKPTSTQTSVSGTYDAEWQVSFGDGTVTTFPNNGNDTVIIADDLDNA